jgi:hypothetical protein
MFGSNSNFTETKNLAMAIVADRDAITFALVLLKVCEYPSLPGHMICASTIEHSTCTTGGVSLQNKLGFCFRYPSLVESAWPRTWLTCLYIGSQGRIRGLKAVEAERSGWLATWMASQPSICSKPTFPSRWRLPSAPI